MEYVEIGFIVLAFVSFFVQYRLVNDAKLFPELILDVIDATCNETPLSDTEVVSLVDMQSKIYNLYIAVSLIGMIGLLLSVAIAWMEEPVNWVYAAAGSSHIIAIVNRNLFPSALADIEIHLLEQRFIN